MERQALFYETPRPVNKDRHMGWSVDVRTDFGFARETNAIPLTTAEFEIAARDFPIVFTQAGDSVAPAALLGLRDRENLFVDANGRWKADYIPAFIRRYPFIFAHDAKAQTYTLCIDEASPLCNKEDRGNPLFNDAGAPSAYMTRMLDLLRQWQRALQDSHAFSVRLRDLKLLQPSEIKFRMDDGQAAKTGGFLAVDRKLLRDLPAETVVEMHRNGDLALVHAHLLSMHNLQSLREDLGSTDKPS